MAGFVGFAKNYFFIFLLSSIFGKLMSDSGAAKVIATKMAGAARKVKTNQKYIVLVVFALITLVLTLGGVSGFVVYFIMVSLGRSLFEELDIPWHFYMATTFTAAMGMIPGNPAIQNLSPMN